MGSTATTSFKILCEEVHTGDIAQLTPGKLQKVVHLVRHGQGTHNVFAAGKITEGEPCHCMLGLPGCPYLNAAHEDAKLTQRGRLQATAVGPQLIRTKPIPQVAFISPLFRTLQTADIGLSTISQFNIPMIAEESIRERIGLHICDKRSEKQKVYKMFQKVDFSNIADGPDPLFSIDTRETEQETANRGKQFFLTLKDREETSIAVVSHSSFLFNTLSKAFVTDPNTSRRFSTGEVRCVLLTYEQE